MSNFFKKLRIFNEQTSALIYFAPAFYHLSLAFLINQATKILGSLSVIALYPYITPSLLYGLEYFSYFLMLIGTLIFLFPFIKLFFKQDSLFFKTWTVISKVLATITIILVPIGTFLGMGMLRDLKASISIKKPGTKSTISSEYLSFFLFQLTFGIVFLLTGGFIFILVYQVLLEELAFLYPYITYHTLLFLLIFGWINLIGGMGTLFFSLRWKFKKISLTTEANTIFSIHINLYLVLLFVLLFMFPFGTFFSSSILLYLFSQRNIVRNS